MFAVLTAISIAVSSCHKDTLENQAELNKGALIWHRALDSFKVQYPGQQAVVFRAYENPDLADDEIVFFADGTGIRNQGERLFWAAPQVKTLKFSWQLDPKQTNVFQMYGEGVFDPSRPYNDVSMSVDLYHDRLKLFVTPVTENQPFLVYWFHQIPQ